MSRALAHDPRDRFAAARTKLLALDQMEVELEAPPPDLYADEPSRATPLDLSEAPVEPTPLPQAFDLADPPTPIADALLLAQPSLPSVIPPPTTHSEMVGNRPFLGAVILIACAGAVFALIRFLG